MIRERRIMVGLTQQQLAGLLGVTYQQTHKYEKGVNRVSAGRLFEIAQILEVPVGAFYEGLPPVQDDVPSFGFEREKMMLELARNFAGITNEQHQEAVSRLARALAGSGQDNPADRPRRR
jgi:transcriptional regulator with XRE-family HTH domain